MTKKLLIFDFDGVIEDTFELGFGFFKEQVLELTHDEYRSWYDGNFYTLVKEKGVPLDMNIYYGQYALALKERIISPNIKEILIKLHEQFPLALVSSSHEVALNEYLERNGISGLFDQVWGVKKHASKTEKLKALIAEHKISPKDCWFVTDTVGDLKEAEEVSIKGIAVSWGFHSDKRLEQAKPAVVLNFPQELLTYLK